MLDEQLTAITGETGAGKTIFSNAIGLLLGARGDAALIGAAGDEAYVEAEFGAVDDEVLGPLAELRPDGEDGLVLARRIFADGRTRAYAWGRAAAREDVAAAAEALIAMSGQFEQRRLSRPAYQLGVLDAYAGLGELRRAARTAWRDLGAARQGPRRADAGRRRGRGTPRRAARPGRRHGRPRAGPGDRAPRRARAAAPGRRARPGGRRGCRGALARRRRRARPTGSAAAERLVAPLEQLAPELAAAGSTLREAELALRETVHELRAFLASLEAEPGRLEQVEVVARRDRDAQSAATAPQSFEELLARADAARAELAALEDGHDPVRAAAEALGGRRGGGRAAARASCVRDALAAASRLRRRGGAGAGRRRSRRRRVSGRAARAGARRDRRRRGGVPDPAEHRPPVRACRRDGVGRRALARGARDRCRRRRRDDDLRRDRRRHRRHHGARRRRHAQAPRRAGPGRDDHASAADRDGRRPSLPGREGARRPDGHADRGARRRPAPGRGRAHARRRRVPRLPRTDEPRRLRAACRSSSGRRRCIGSSG